MWTSGPTHRRAHQRPETARHARRHHRPVGHRIRAHAHPGRGHHRDCFSIWRAGGGFKPGHVHGRSDDIGKYTIEDPVEVHDLHATILHQVGMDHEKLTFRHAGRDFRLTDVHGRILTGLLA